MTSFDEWEEALRSPDMGEVLRDASDPTSPSMLAVRLLGLLEAGRRNSAARLAVRDSRLAGDDTSVKALCLYAEAVGGKMRLIDAEAQIGEMVHQDPSPPMPSWLLANLGLLLKRDYAGILAEADRLLVEYPRSCLAKQLRAAAQLWMKTPNKALETLAEMEDCHPSVERFQIEMLASFAVKDRERAVASRQVVDFDHRHPRFSRDLSE